MINSRLAAGAGGRPTTSWPDRVRNGPKWKTASIIAEQWFHFGRFLPSEKADFLTVLGGFA